MASEASHGVECEWGGALWWWPLFGTLGEGGLVTDTVTLTPTARRCNRVGRAAVVKGFVWVGIQG
jgi:hypothetical protein